MNTLSDFELGWLVGLLEGEGYFGLGSTPKITVKMTDEDSVQRVALLFRKITGREFLVREDTSPSRVYSKRQPVFYVIACGNNAREIMRLVAPYMHYRRRQRIWQILNGYRAPKLKVNLVQLGLMKEIQL